MATDADGVVRIGATRVTLDTVVVAFEQGATAEEILDARRARDHAPQLLQRRR